MNVKILVCCHKLDIWASDSPYVPIHVGKELHPELDLKIQEDNAGDSISNKNDSYCELTGMYWAWKYLKNVDVIGLCHYRRYFDFHKQCKWPYPITSFTTSQFKLLDFSIPQSVVDRILKGGIVVPRSVIYPIPLFYDYASCHIGSDMRIIQQIIEEKGDAKFINAFEDVMFRNNKLIHYNMFIMKWDDFNNYCNWLFPILKEAEKRIDISHYNVIQKRIWGYMAERLMNVWLYAEKKNLLFYPVIWINNNSSNMETRIKYLCRTLRYNLINKLATLQLTFKTK